MDPQPQFFVGALEGPEATRLQFSFSSLAFHSGQCACLKLPWRLTKKVTKRTKRLH